MSAQLDGITMHAMERYEKNGSTGRRIGFNPSDGVALRRRPIAEMGVNPSSCFRVGGVESHTPLPRRASPLACS